MPTEYTAAIAEGCTFNEYAMLCARAFGATVTMRDEPMDAEIPDSFTPSTYHAERLAELRERLSKLRSMSDKEAETEAKREYDAAVSARLDSIQSAANLRRKYEAILAEVNAYTPPSPDHVEFKNFMRSQIEESIKWDCAVYGDVPELESGPVWRARSIKRVLDDIEYHEREHAEEIRRCEDRSRWVRQLRKSLTECL